MGSLNPDPNSNPVPYPAQAAVQKGLVDQIGTFEDAVEEAKKLAGAG